jgi:flagellar hook protein FlgE
MMANINNASLTALNAYNTLLENTASNVANINTGEYRPLQTTMEDAASAGVTATTSRNENIDRVDLSQEAVSLITAETWFKANIKVLKTAQKMQKRVIDIIA